MSQGAVESPTLQSQSSATSQVPARSLMVQRLLDASASLPTFIHDLLTQQAVMVAATEAAAFMVERGEGGQTLRNIAHIRPDNASADVRAAALDAFGDLVRPCLAQNKEGLIELGNPGESGEPQFCLITPLRSEGEVVAVTAVITRAINLDRAKQRLMSMQLVAGYFDLYNLRRQSDQTRLVAQSHQNVLQLTNAVATSSGFQQACLNLCNELAGRTSASRVSLGWLKHHRVRVQALSHTEEFDKRQELIVQIESAMEECLDQEQLVQYSNDGSSTPNVTRSAASLSRGQGGNTVLSLPMRRRDEIIGVVCLEFLPGVQISPSMAQGLAVAVDLLAPQLYDRYVNDRWLITKAGISAREAAKVIVGPKHMLAKLIAIVCAALVAFVILYKPMYNVSAPFELKPIAPRAISMPFEEQIEAVDKRVGDSVKKGDRLIQVRTFNLKEQLRSALLKAARARAESDQARTRGDAAEAEIKRKEYLASQIEVDLLNKRIEEATIVAPFDGDVVRSEVEDKLNKPFKEGEFLMEVARTDDLQAEVKVSDSDITRLWNPKPDGRRQVGYVATNSDPRNRRKITIDRVVPMTVQEGGNNYFKVYARLEDPDSSWKPGMVGEARIEVEHRPLIYIWTHKLTDFIRMKLWM